MSNLKEVTREEFYKAIGPLDVMPSIVGKINDKGGAGNFDGYIQEWSTRNRVLVGRTESPFMGEPRYWLVKP